MDKLWNFDEPILEIVHVPDYVDQDITGATVAAIVQGGCASGSYMPAVTYSDANRTMSEHGNRVLEDIESAYGELPQPPPDSSWDGIAVFYLSMAVELWAHGVLDELIGAIESDDEEDSDDE